MEYINKRFVIENSPIAEVVCRNETASTNSLAKELVRKNKTALPVLVVAQKQIVGRGQQANKWWSNEGSLTFSVAFEPDHSTPNVLLSMTSALAVANSISEFATAENVHIKWPNDVFLGNKKVAGILIESVVQNGTNRIIVGIGINSNCSIKSAPPEIQDVATSIIDQTNKPTDPNDLVVNVTNNLFKWMHESVESPQKIVAQFESRSVFKPQSELKIRTPDGRSTAGKFVGFSDQGELIVESRDGRLSFSSARIEAFSISRS